MADPTGALFQAAAKRISSAGSILCFHSITEPNLPSASSTHVPLDVLRSAVSAGRRLGEIVRLSELIERHRSGRSTAGLIAITFDDAYAALMASSAAFLREQAVPLTVFVTTEAARTGARFWWDRLEESFANVSVARWEAFERDCGLPQVYLAGQPADLGRMRPLRQWLLREFQGRWPAQLEAALASLERDAGTETSHRSMTFDEIARLGKQVDLEVGVHTLTHPVLPLLDDDELVREIAASHRSLQEQADRVLPVLAIPYGLYDARTLRLARAAGIQTSLSLAGRTLRHVPSDDELPRFCLMREEPAWKLHLRLLGIGDRLQELRSAGNPLYPPLPSPTT